MSIVTVVSYTQGAAGLAGGDGGKIEDDVVDAGRIGVTEGGGNVSEVEIVRFGGKVAVWGTMVAKEVSRALIGVGVSVIVAGRCWSGDGRASCVTGGAICVVLGKHATKSKTRPMQVSHR